MKNKIDWKKIKKSTKKYGKKLGKTRLAVSDWIENNINPDIYSGGFGDMDIDIDPWNPYGHEKRRKKK